MTRVDVNADLGEGYPTDKDILPWISSANIAAGGHAGGGDTLTDTVALAAEHSVAVGAHISYPDKENFGRTSLKDLAPALLTSALEEQIAEVLAVTSLIGVPLTHVKPHGALYNDAARDHELAETICRIITNTTPTGVAIFGLSQSHVHTAATNTGVPFIAEGFADRTYQPDGHLRSRLLPGSIHTEDGIITRQALALATQQPFPAYGGVHLTIPVDSICVHGDTPEAARHTRRIHQTLTDAGVTITAPHTGASKPATGTPGN